MVFLPASDPDLASIAACQLQVVPFVDCHPTRPITCKHDLCGAVERDLEHAVFKALVDVMEVSPSGWALPIAEIGERHDAEVQAKLRELATAYKFGCLSRRAWQLANDHLNLDLILAFACECACRVLLNGNPRAEGFSRSLHFVPGGVALQCHLLSGHEPQPPARRQTASVGEPRSPPHTAPGTEQSDIILVNPHGQTAAWSGVWTSSS